MHSNILIDAALTFGPGLIVYATVVTICVAIGAPIAPGVILALALGIGVGCAINTGRDR